MHNATDHTRSLSSGRFRPAHRRTNSGACLHGPGLGLGAIGSALGIVSAVLLAIVSVIWYPFKRMLRRMRGGITAVNNRQSTSQS